MQAVSSILLIVGQIVVKGLECSNFVHLNQPAIKAYNIASLENM